MEGSLDPFEQLLTIIEMKNENKKNRNFDKKSGFRHPEKNQGCKKYLLLIYIIIFFWTYVCIACNVYDELRKMLKNDCFGRKPDSGKKVAGKKFASGNFIFSADFIHTSKSGTIKKI